ncbi:dienelactone hydrolase family protein [Actinomadura mexicana]|uniref:Carboxymethylenebutenolidase n=1 Tax=Actinomadura mexicana TaxID=134959 RepID=A0A239AUW7_9ACTN|nr:dienelactone hydrolase family protein [Actinomadura mexicana]SNR99319.1 carboxymethylenebutenolidase [Actinomadura mexicana]
MTRTEKVVVPGGEFDLRVWGTRGPGILLLQEIFGVGEYLEAVAEDLVALGFVVAAPDLFWRIEPNWTAEHNEQGVPKAMAMVAQFDVEKGVEDAVAALEVLRGLPEVDAVGVVGFCLGGTLAYLVAARAQVDALVSYYGSDVPNMLDRLDAIQAPTQFHFGGDDAYIPREDVAKVERAVGEKDHMEIHVQEDGGHAFHNRKAPMFYQPEPAARAWRLTEDFLRRTLPA